MRWPSNWALPTKTPCAPNWAMGFPPSWICTKPPHFLWMPKKKSGICWTKNKNPYANAVQPISSSLPTNLKNFLPIPKISTKAFLRRKPVWSPTFCWKRHASRLKRNFPSMSSSPCGRILLGSVLPSVVCPKPLASHNFLCRDWTAHNCRKWLKSLQCWVEIKFQEGSPSGSFTIWWKAPTNCPFYNMRSIKSGKWQTKAKPKWTCCITPWWAAWTETICPVKMPDVLINGLAGCRPKYRLATNSPICKTC